MGSSCGEDAPSLEQRVAELELQNYRKEASSGPRPPNDLQFVCLLGETGVGKSTLAGLLAGDLKEEGGVQRSEMFPACAGTEACTKTAALKSCRWSGSGSRFWMVDTPGFGAGSDDLDVEQMAQTLNILREELGFVTVFALVFHAGQVRFTGQHGRMLHLLQGTFGPQFWAHVVIIYTHWAVDRKSVKKRGPHNERFRREAMLKNLRQLASPPSEAMLEQMKFFFFDAMYEALCSGLGLVFGELHLKRSCLMYHSHNHNF